MHKRSRAVLIIVAGVLFAGLLWASQSLADFVHRPSGTRAGVAAKALSEVRPGERPRVASRTLFVQRTPGSWTNIAAGARGQVNAASPSMSPVSLTPQSYSMSAPEFLSDPAAGQALAIAVGDVSGDGRDDLVFLSRRYTPIPADFRTEIHVAYQNSNGHLDAAVKIAESGNNLAYQVLIADLDNDGVGDIITDTVDGVMVLRSNADGTFTSSTTVVGDPQKLIVTDVDRDGHLDILVDSHNTTATVVHGDGRGGISHLSSLPLPSSAVRATGDVTGDGLDDLVLATIYSRPLQEFRIYPALASGGYGPPVVLYRPLDANQTASVAIGDFNGDGRNDLMLDEARDGANLQLYLQDSQGNFTSSQEIVRNRGAGTLLAADLNRDGRSDVAFAHDGWGYIGYYLQTETGITPENVINAYQYQGRYNYFVTGDLNHDGCGDLVIARVSQSPVLLYGRGCARRQVADCQLPALAMNGSGIQAIGLPAPLVRR